MKKHFWIKNLFVVLISSFLFLLPNIAASVDAQNKNFRDDFTGQTIRPEWKIFAEDKDRYAFIGGDYLLLVTKSPRVNIFAYNTDRLPENFEVTIKLEEAPTDHGQSFVLELWQNEKNNLRLGVHVKYRWWFLVYEKNLRGENSRYEKQIEIPQNHSLQLKINKQSVEYIGTYSINQSTWQEIGSHVFLNLNAKPGFAAYNRENTAPESPVKIDFFEIKELQ